MDIEKEFTKTYEIIISHKNSIINKNEQTENLDEKNKLINMLLDIDLKIKNYENELRKNVSLKE